MNKRGKIKAVFNWSGGKDSALALNKTLRSGEYEIVSLLTTVNRNNNLSSMHNISLSLLRKQAESIGIPLYTVELTPEKPTGNYEQALSEAIEHFKNLEVTHFIFGDIFLHDVRTYREKQLAPYGISVVEPLWGKTSEEIIQEFLASGLQTVIVTVTASVLGKEFVGQTLDKKLVAAFPANTDICGENGEYHTFCYAGGMFRKPVPFGLGEPTLHTYPIRQADGTVKEYSYWCTPVIDPDTVG